jgi:gluconolactonase
MGLLEAPVYDPRSGEFLFSDATGGGVWKITSAGEVVNVVPKRRGVGGMAIGGDDGYIVSGRTVAWTTGRETRDLLFVDPALGLNRFNDLTTDQAGRIYAGSIDFDFDLDRKPNEGRLEVVDVDGTTRVEDTGCLAANGLGFSPDGHRLYFADSVPGVVRCYDVAADGKLSNRRPFLSWTDASPDGLAIAEDGSIWVALPKSDSVGVYAADGSELKRIPVPHPTSVCFGGDDLRTLFITTFGPGLDAQEGSAYLVEIDRPGLPLAPAAAGR